MEEAVRVARAANQARDPESRARDPASPARDPAVDPGRADREAASPARDPAVDLGRADREVASLARDQIGGAARIHVTEDMDGAAAVTAAAALASPAREGELEKFNGRDPICEFRRTDRYNPQNKGYKSRNLKESPQCYIVASPRRKKSIRIVPKIVSIFGGYFVCMSVV